MTRQELLQEIKRNGMETTYRKELDKATRYELEAMYYAIISPPDSNKHISYSQLNMYQKCGLQYFYRYILGYKIPPDGGLVRGSSLHRTWKHDGEEKLKTGNPLSISDKREIYHSAFEEESQEAQFKEDEPKEEMLKTGEEAIPIHHKATERDIIIAVEDEYRMVVDDVEVVGFVDKIIQTGVRDYKVKGKSMSAQDMFDPQLPIYAIMTGIDDVGYEPYVITKTGCKAQIEISVDRGKGTPIPLHRTVSEEEKKRATTMLKVLIDAIDKRVFMPCKSSDWVCTPKWCGFYDLCHEEMLDN